MFTFPRITLSRGKHRPLIGRKAQLRAPDHACRVAPVLVRSDGCQAVQSTLWRGRGGPLLDVSRTSARAACRIAASVSGPLACHPRTKAATGGGKSSSFHVHCVSTWSIRSAALNTPSRPVSYSPSTMRRASWRAHCTACARFLGRTAGHGDARSLGMLMRAPPTVVWGRLAAVSRWPRLADAGRFSR
jgi:hypothetical protein